MAKSCGLAPDGRSQCYHMLFRRELPPVIAFDALMINYRQRGKRMPVTTYCGVHASGLF
jgi:hypothetical protein